MIRTLVELIAQFAIFLETADESILSLEHAVSLQEEMAYRLQKLSDQERATFVEVLNEIAESEEFKSHADIIASLPEDTGIA